MNYEKYLLFILIYKLFTILAGLISIIIGYKLFVKGIFGDAGEMEVKLGANQITLKRAAPGIFFSLFGSIIICYTTFKGFTITDYMDTSSAIDQHSITKKEDYNKNDSSNKKIADADTAKSEAGILPAKTSRTGSTVIAGGDERQQAAPKASVTSHRFQVQSDGRDEKLMTIFENIGEVQSIKVIIARTLYFRDSSLLNNKIHIIYQPDSAATPIIIESQSFNKLLNGLQFFKNEVFKERDPSSKHICLSDSKYFSSIPFDVKLRDFEICTYPVSGNDEWNMYVSLPKNNENAVMYFSKRNFEIFVNLIEEAVKKL